MNGVLKRVAALAGACITAATMAGAEPAPTPASAPVCVGTDLIAALPAHKRAALDAAVAGVPYAKGTRWVARKGDARIEIIGTYHFDDPRHDPIVAALTPIISGAAVLLVEAGPDEEKQLKAALVRDPTLMVDPGGPTLPERLTATEWQDVANAMSERGMPAVLVSQMRPWYVSMMMGISPCMLSQMKVQGGISGLDHRLMAVATSAGVPVRGLEPWDTALSLFSDLTPAEEIDMIRAALPAARLADDYGQTTIEAYFRGDVWALWEFGRMDAYESSGLDRAAVDRQVKLAQDRLMDRRNQSWIAPLTQAASAAAADGKPVVAAFGALHLPGKHGVLHLLEQDGWTITPSAAW